ncbi:MAG: ABC transporter substrate-binding protein, partial [Alphaproteobacteria bacterium]|nr:ABC transporter substrate-binding protein [Alphaproteobacteria bacterium]
TDATTQALQVKTLGGHAVLGCVYQQELVILLRDLHKFGVNVPVVGARGADIDHTNQQVNNPAAVRGKFFQPYGYKAKIGTSALKEIEDIFVKHLKKDELPKAGPPTNYYYLGVPVGIVTVEGFRRAGPNPSREKWIAAIESIKDFDTGVLADKVTFSKEKHVGVSKMHAVGLDKDGKQTVFTGWNMPLPE